MLDEIKKDFEWGIKVGGEGQGYTNLDDEQVEWLIEQVSILDKVKQDILLITNIIRFTSDHNIQADLVSLNNKLSEMCSNLEINYK